MSTLIKKSRPAVMVRGYKGQPSKLWAAAVSDGYVDVESENRQALIRLPMTDVFEFNDASFQKLSSAFCHGDHKSLAQAWGMASPFSHPELAG